MSMPQGGEPGQPRNTAEQAGHQWQGGPGQDAVPDQGGATADATGGQQWAGPQGQQPPGGVPGQPAGAQQHPGGPQQQWPYGAGPEGTAPAQHPGGPAGQGPVSPVAEIETRVTGRRVVQYIIDYIITGVVASLIIWALDRGTGAVNAILVLVGVILAVAWYFWYWVYRPYHAGGQSIGMQLLGVRVISKDGGRASMVQLFIRGILLIVDTLIWGLVGWITIICSRYRQRIGDHAANTLVVRAQVEAVPARHEYAGTERAGTR